MKIQIFSNPKKIWLNKITMLAVLCTVYNILDIKRIPENYIDSISERL